METNTNNHVFAGWWLVIAGLILFVAVNAMLGASGLSSIEWSPSFIALLGILVLLRFHFANVLARLMGSFTIVALVLAVLLFLSGVSGETQTAESNESVADPSSWQVASWFIALAATFLPPWWSLQKLVAANHQPRT